MTSFPRWLCGHTKALHWVPPGIYSRPWNYTATTWRKSWNDVLLLRCLCQLPANATRSQRALEELPGSSQRAPPSLMNSCFYMMRDKILIESYVVSHFFFLNILTAPTVRHYEKEGVIELVCVVGHTCFCEAFVIYRTKLWILQWWLGLGYPGWFSSQ